MILKITVGHILAWQERLEGIKDGPSEFLHDRLRAFISAFRVAHEDDPKADEILVDLLSWLYD